MPLRNPKNQKPHGFTLTEMAIVMGIIGMVLGAIWTAASSARNNQKNAQTTQDILAIVSAVRGMYSANSAVTAGMLESRLVAADALPPSMIGPGNTIRNAYGTTGASQGNPNGIAVTSNTGYACSGGTPGQFGIVIFLPPTSACVSIMMSMTGPGASANGVNCLYSDGTGVVAIDGSATAAIAAGCGGNVAVGFNL